MNKFLLLSLSILAAIASCAQPQYFGCHFYKNQHVPHELTDEQRAMMEASILRSDTFDILNYDITIDVTDEVNQAITCSTTLTYTPKFDDLNTILLDLYQLEVDSVTAYGEALDYNYDQEIVQIWFSDSPSVEDTLQLTVHYHGEPHRDVSWGGFYFELGYIYNLGIGISTIPPNFGKVWYPCFDTFLERATYAYHVKSANGKVAVCQGTFISEEALGGDTLVSHWILDKQIPTYLSAIAVSEYTSSEYIHEGLNGDILVQLTAKTGMLAAMESIFVELNFAIDALEYWYGPYVWDRVGYILTTDGALEIPTNIAYPAFMTGQSLFTNGQLFAHELAHHWWGDVITLKEHNHMWIKEGPAEYGGHLFVEWKDGEEAFVDLVKDNMLFVLQEAHLDDNGFHPLSPMPDAHIYGRHTYYKGAAVLHNLRGYLGDDAFKEMMHAMQDQYAWQSMYPEELRDAMEDVSGVQLDDFFDDQIFTPGFSVFTVDQATTTENSSEFVTELSMRQLLREAPEFHNNVPLDVTLVDDNWNKTHYEIVADGQISSASVTSNFDPAMIYLNGRNRLNQARMDAEIVLRPDETYNAIAPHTNFRLIKNEVSDSTFVRVEHIWAGPSIGDLGEGIWQVAARQYWTVTGIFPESYDLEARINYKGVNPLDLDYDLVSETEEDLVLIYRPDASQSWEVYPDFTLVDGNPTSGTGSMKIDVLIPGEYALANGDASVDVEEITVEENSILHAYPNPAKTDLNLFAVSNRFDHQVGVEIHDLNGKLIYQKLVTPNENELLLELDIVGWSRGLYVVSLLDAFGNIIDSVPFEAIP